MRNKYLIFIFVILTASAILAITLCLLSEQKKQYHVYLSEPSLSVNDMGNFESNLALMFKHVEGISKVKLRLNRLKNQLNSSGYLIDKTAIRILGIELNLDSEDYGTHKRFKEKFLPAISKALFLTNLEKLASSIQLSINDKKADITELSNHTNLLNNQIQKLQRLPASKESYIGIPTRMDVNIPINLVENSRAEPQPRNEISTKSYSDDYNFLPVAQQILSLRSFSYKNGSVIKQAIDDIQQLTTAITQIEKIKQNILSDKNTDTEIIAADILKYSKSLRMEKPDIYRALVLNTKGRSLDYIHAEYVGDVLPLQFIKNFVFAIVLLSFLTVLIVGYKTKLLNR